MTIATEDEIKLALARAGRIATRTCTISINTSVQLWEMWRQYDSDAGAIPSVGGGDACDSSTPGALELAAVDGGEQLYVLRAAVIEWDTISQVGREATYLILDRLVHASGLVANTLLAQTVNTVALPSRATGGDGVMCFIEVWSGIGSLTQVATVSYTNQAGTAGRTGTVTLAAGSLFAGGISPPLTLQTGDTGVRSVETVTLSASQATAGNFGVLLAKPKLWTTGSFMMPAVDRQETQHMAILTPIDADACLSWARRHAASNTSTALTVVTGAA